MTPPPSHGGRQRPTPETQQAYFARALDEGLNFREFSQRLDEIAAYQQP